jgi:hypothetical protein
VYLGQHPELFVSRVKEPRHFLSPGTRPHFTGPRDEELVNAPLVWNPSDYASLFADCGDHQHAGDLSQTYLGFPGTAEAVRAYHPDMRIIAVLRHPVERAFSSWSAHRRDGYEPLRSFEEAIDAEEDRIASGWAPIWWYTERGWYGRALTSWYEQFPKDQIKVWLYDDVRRDLFGLLRETYEFLGVDPSFVADVAKEHNVSLVPRSQRLDRFVRSPSDARRAIGRLVPSSWRAAVGARVLAANRRRLTLAPDTRRRLLDRYRGDLHVLGELLDRDLSGWLEG